MMRTSVSTLLVAAAVLCSVCPAGGIPEHIDGWRVERGPAGNDYYQPKGDEPDRSEVSPPSEAVLRYPKIFTPAAKVTNWDFDDGAYEVTCQRGPERWRFTVTPEGELQEIQYKNRRTDTQEEADELVFMGTKKPVKLDSVPPAALSVLEKAYPGQMPQRAFTAQTTAGLRYGIQIGEMVFYARNDGQIQAAGSVSEGALGEIHPPQWEKDEAKFKAALDKYLGRYRRRFNFANQIKKLGTSPRSADGSYRYVVMGDSRSNRRLWQAMVKHISSLKPRPDFVINTGDIVGNGYIGEFRDYYIPPLLETDIPFFVAVGNHETGDDDKAREFRYLFGENSLNYYFDYGKTRYVFFDNASDVGSTEQRLRWLDETLAGTPTGYRKCVAAHKPPATIQKWSYHAWKEKPSAEFTALITKHGVSEVYLGHIHAYSTAQYNGVRYTLTGGGGAHLHNRFGPRGNVHHYVICDVQPDGSVKQQVVRFYPAEESTAQFRFTVTGDPRNELSKWQHVLNEMAEKTGGVGAFHISCGDYFQHGAVTTAKDFYDRLCKTFGDDVVWYPAVGNHETQDDSTDMEWLRKFYHEHLRGTVNPGPPRGEETTYSFDYENAHFVVLNQYYDGTNDKCRDGDIRPPLFNWLVEDLRKNTKPLIFVVYHEPVFPSGRGGKDWEARESRARFWKLLKDHKVVAAFCAHTHRYGRGRYGDNPYTWEIDVGNAGRQSHADAHQTFLEVIVTEEKVRFNAWQGLEGEDFRITDSWDVPVPGVGASRRQQSQSGAGSTIKAAA